MKQTYQTGLDGETAAEKWLRDRFRMKCLERRYRTKAGEIDLIMMDRDTIVFVEVKTRNNASHGIGVLAVDRSKQRRIARAAMLYLVSKGKLSMQCRFDIVEVCLGDILHIPNAFQPGGMFFR